MIDDDGAPTWRALRGRRGWRRLAAARAAVAIAMLVVLLAPVPYRRYDRLDVALCFAPDCRGHVGRDRTIATFLDVVRDEPRQASALALPLLALAGLAWERAELRRGAPRRRRTRAAGLRLATLILAFLATAVLGLELDLAGELHDLLTADAMLPASVLLLLGALLERQAIRGGARDPEPP